MEIPVPSFWILFLVLISSYIKFGFCSGIHNVSCIPLERNALLAFKKGLTDPGDRLSSWSGQDCCSWNGVQCKGGHVIKLKLGNSNAEDGATYALGGEVHSSLLDLKYLSYLDLSMNNFEGISIPDFIGSLESLKYLNLSGASFGGIIPPHLGNLSRLNYLDISVGFGVAIESDLHWLPGLSSLKYLNLGSVDLSKAASYWLQAVNLMPSLVELRLRACGLSTLPPSLPAVNISSLSVIDLANNGFNTSIPSWLFEITQLVYLDMSSNNLEGTIPDEFSGLSLLQHLDLSENSFINGTLSRNNLGSLCNLRYLDLSVNKISGDVSDFVDSLSKCRNSSLEFLHLGYNDQLGGILPDSLGNLRNLKHLRLMKNSFVGSIPESIGNLSSLTEFSLTESGMTGTIPTSLGRLSSLVSLDISKNQWEGFITEAHFSNLTNLKELSIVQTSYRNTTLFFNVSSSWIPPFKLRYLNLKACRVGPDFPPWLRNQNELESVSIWIAGMEGAIPDWFWELDLVLDELDFSYNQLTGTVPNTIKFNPSGIVFLNRNFFTGPLPVLSSNLSSFHLDNNLFSGPIPGDIGEKMPNVADFDISYNSLTGSIPSSIGNMSYLLTFVVSSNNLSGKIPDIWNNLLGVYVIDMSNNSLSGDIPVSMASLTSIKFLKLSMNHLSGAISSVMQNCTAMETLDLGDNNFSGKIPSWMGEKMQSLLVLSLRSNFFTGYIPTTLCDLSSLHILDLAENSLSGNVPRCVGNLNGMSISMDDPRYEGQLWVVAKGRDMYYDGNLYLVNSINMGSNNLSGVIPEGLKNLSRLGTLNLSMNHFTGKIPASIGSLQRLETLDLSRNQLFGTIPPTMVSMTALNHLNLSHNKLSGQIPTANQFLTFTDPSIYEGNDGLCGPPLNSCSFENEPASPLPGGGETGSEDDVEMFGFYMSLAMGFVVGFWGVCGTLIVKRSWRHAYFRYFDDMKERFRVCVSFKSAAPRPGAR